MHIEPVQEELGKLDGRGAILWSYTASLEELVVRFNRADTKGVVDVHCNACSRIIGPTGWQNARVRIEHGAEAGVVVIRDLDANFEVTCRLVRVLANSGED